MGIIYLKTKKEIQKYYLKKFDIVATILILVATISIAYQRYGINFDIKYESTDASTHYIAAKQFFKNKTLLANPQIEDELYGFEKFMPSAYVNTGILFDISSSFIQEENFYIIYIMFDIMILYLGAMLFYVIATKNTKKIFLKIK